MSMRSNFVHRSFAIHHPRRADLLTGEGWLKGFAYAFQDEQTFNDEKDSKALQAELEQSLP